MRAALIKRKLIFFPNSHDTFRIIHALLRILKHLSSFLYCLDSTPCSLIHPFPPPRLRLQEWKEEEARGGKDWGKPSPWPLASGHGGACHGGPATA